MFVSKRRWILKTCGTTTPLQCLEPLLAMAEQIGGFSDVEALFYSRKNFKRPDLQVSAASYSNMKQALQQPIICFPLCKGFSAPWFRRRGCTIGHVFR